MIENLLKIVNFQSYLDNFHKHVKLHECFSVYDCWQKGKKARSIKKQVIGRSKEHIVEQALEKRRERILFLFIIYYSSSSINHILQQWSFYICPRELSSKYDTRFFLPVYIADKRTHHLSQKNGEHVHIIMKITRSICAGNGMRWYYTRITSRVSRFSQLITAITLSRIARGIKSRPRAIYRVTTSKRRRHTRAKHGGTCIAVTQLRMDRAASRSTSFSRPTVTLFILLW